jgi:hypothetical protein
MGSDVDCDEFACSDTACGDVPFEDGARDDIS